MSSQERKIAIRYKDRMAVIRAAFKPEEYDKHRVHKKQIERWVNEEREREAHKELIAAVG
ncbi:MAG TPA: hypothetical protein VF290_02605 [Pyrinomonadaceae bacterium]